MTKFINRPVDVAMGPEGVPVSFRFAGGRERVRDVLDVWLETGRWWEQERERVTYRVATANGGIFELTWDPFEKRWFLYKCYD